MTAAGPLALRLMDLIFTHEEMASGNCTAADGRDLLHADIISGIMIVLICRYIFSEHMNVKNIRFWS